MITRKRKMDFTDASIQELMQETYSDIIQAKNLALVAYKKFSKNIEENNDIALVGRVTNELLKVVDNTIDKKIQLLKFQASVLYKTGKTTEETKIGGTASKLSEDDKKMVQDMLKEQKSANFNNIKKYE